MRQPQLPLYDPSLFKEEHDLHNFLLTLLKASTGYALIGTDTEGRIMLWNEGARLRYGYEPEEVVGKKDTSLLYIPEDLKKGKREQIKAATLQDGKWEGTLIQRCRNGEVFITQSTVLPWFSSAGEVRGFLIFAKDLSEEIRLTEELKAKEFYNRSLLEANIDALVTTNPLGVITDLNKQMMALTGYTRKELIGFPFKQCFDSPEQAEDAIRTTLREGTLSNCELTVLTKDGSKIPVSCNMSIFRDAEGKLVGVLAAARVITEQKALEQKLRDSEAYNRGLIEASVDGLIMVDPSGVIKDVNTRLCQMTGFTAEELIGTQLVQYFTDRNRVERGLKETFEQGMITDYALNMITNDGRELIVSINASVFKDPHGKVCGIFASARDITEQAYLQQQLMEERAYNRGLLEASLDGLVTVDRMLNITDVNAEMCRMTGYSRSELIGSPFPQYFTDVKAAAAGVRLTLEKGALTNYELMLRCKDGRERLVSFNAAIFKDKAGKVRGIFASARDITEQSLLQRQLTEERAYNRGLIEASVDGLLTVDEAMVITDVNETICRMAGRTRNQLIGSSFPSYFLEQEEAAKGVSLAFQEGSITNYNLTLQGAEGRLIPVSLNAAVFKDSRDQVKGIFVSARDITAQKRLEMQLQASQFYTRSLIESSIDTLMTTDCLGYIADVNQQMIALTGYSREELIGTPFKDYFTDPERAEEGIKLVLKEGKVNNYELNLRGKTGKVTVVSFNAAILYDHQGGLQGVFIAARDITEQKKLECQLRDSQVYNRGLIEASADGLLTVDPDGYITDVNERICQMSGYSRAELLGTQFAEYFTEPGRAWAGVRETFEKGVITEYMLTLVCRTRRLMQVSFNASVFRDPCGNVRGIFASARDITDRVRLEEQLREQQTYLRGLIESSVDGLITVDPEGYITDVNEQMCRMTGYRREELIGSLFKQYFVDPGRAETAVKTTLAEGVVTNYELLLRTKKGHKTMVSFNASTFYNVDHQLQGIFASARDTEEQGRLQKQLSEQQAYNRSLIEANADALFAIAPDDIITDVNQEATRLTGYSRNHLINSQFSAYFTEPESALAAVKKAFKEERVHACELVLVTRFGRRIPVSFNAGVFTDATGKPVGILASARDITNQKTLEQQLRDQQDYTRSLVEANIDAVITTDPLGYITDVNQQMEKLTGRPREELIGTPFKDYFTDPERAEEGIRLVLQEGKVLDYELVALSKDGTKKVVSYNATTFTDRNGKLQGVFAAARDVTERKIFEQALQEKNAELEKANRTKDQFLANMSHELRTPLNAIIGFTGTLLMKLPGPLTPEQEKQLQSISVSARHLLALINDLLDLARIQAGKVQLHPEAVSCPSLIKEVLSTLLPLAEGKKLKLEYILPQQEVLIFTDRRVFSQILLNLVSNGIKFTERGRVWVELIQEQCGGNFWVRVNVHDTGIGIKPEDQEKLFEAFTQVQAGSLCRDGAGLGLPLSKELARLLGGRLLVRSEYGKGSTFTLVLPEKILEG